MLFRLRKLQADEVENKVFTRVSRYTLNSVKRTESQTEAVKLIVKHLFSGRVTQAVFSACLLYTSDAADES